MRIGGCKPWIYFTFVVLLLSVSQSAFGTIYEREVVDSHLNAGVANAIQVGAGDTPLIAYWTIDPSVLGTYGPLQLASRTGATWQLANVDSGPFESSSNPVSMAVDSQGRPHVSYGLSIVIGVGTQLKYAYWDGASWAGEIVDSGPIDSHSSIAMDALDQPQLCYLESDGEYTNLYYARRVAGTWVKEIVSTDPSATSGILRLASDGTPRIVYKTGFPNIIRMASRHPDGSWTTEVVDATSNMVASGIAFVLDQYDRAHVTYYDYGHGYALRYAYQAGSNWTVEPIGGPTPFAGVTSSNALAAANDASIYVAFVTGLSPYSKLRVAQRVNGLWSSDVIEVSPMYLGAVALALDGGGERHVAYYAQTVQYVKGELRYAHSLTGMPNRIIRVPADQPTVQSAVDVAHDGDSVIVSPGVYLENLSFQGKAVVVRSEQGPDVTVLDGGHRGSVVRFVTAEESTSVLQGFTLRNGYAEAGAGISVGNAYPTILNNVIAGNTATSAGGGIVAGSATRIEGNTISDNHGQYGGGLAIGGDVRLLRNRIERNTSAEGGAMSISGNVVIRDNVIQGNTATSRGGAIAMSNFSDPLIVQNVIARNQSPRGGALCWSIASGVRGPYLINNTIVDNIGANGAAIYAGGFDRGALIENNVIAGEAADGLLFRDGSYDARNPIVQSNVVWATSGNRYAGAFPDLTGSYGNMAQDPMLVNPSAGDYRPRPGSPCIDAGETGAPGIGEADLLGETRVVDGDQDGTARIDIGAFEWGAPRILSATVDLAPHVLNLQSAAPWMTAYVESNGFDIASVNLSTVRMAGAVPALPRFVTIGDHNSNGVPDLMLKFSRETLDPLLTSGANDIEVTGSLVTGEAFEGVGVLKVIDPPLVGSVAAVPNPFNPRGVIRFTLSKRGLVTVSLFDVQGRALRHLLAKQLLSAGRHEVDVDGRDNYDRPLASGVYFYQIETTEQVLRGKIAIVK